MCHFPQEILAYFLHFSGQQEIVWNEEQKGAWSIQILVTQLMAAKSKADNYDCE